MQVGRKKHPGKYSRDESRLYRMGRMGEMGEMGEMERDAIHRVCTG
jgi:hypothetical protein